LESRKEEKKETILKQLPFNIHKQRYDNSVVILRTKLYCYLLV